MPSIILDIDLSHLISLRSVFFITHDIYSVYNTLSFLSPSSLASLTSRALIPGDANSAHSHFPNEIECHCVFPGLVRRFVMTLDGPRFIGTILDFQALDESFRGVQLRQPEKVCFNTSYGSIISTNPRSQCSFDEYCA